MNNNKRIITSVSRIARAFFLGCVVAMTCSCEDFLTIYPTDKIVREDFWKSKGDVENVVAEAYRLMSQPDFTYRLIVWGEMRGDNVIEGNNVGSEIRDILEANIRPENSYASWSAFYKVINNCNLVLKYAPEVVDIDPNFSKGDSDVLCGEMYAIRALCHFYLVRTFRDIPLLDEPMEDDNQNLYKKQVKPIEALDFCLEDLALAEELVLTSGNYSRPADNKGRITKDAVRAMRADVLLWKAAFATYEAKDDVKAYYDECIEYCDKVLDARMEYVKALQKKDPKAFTGVVLNDTLPILYPSDAHNGYDITPKDNAGRFSHKPYVLQFASGCNNVCESIFEIQHETRKETGNKEVPYFYGYSSDEGKSFTVGLLSASRYVALEAQGFYARTDFRRVNYVYSQKEGSKELDKYGIIKYGHSAASENRKEAKDDFTFGQISYTYLPSNDDGGRFYDKNTVNWIVYRISDVILMKAEALALRNTGTDLTDAFKLVATVYNRSQTGYMGGDNIPVGKAESTDLLLPGSYVTNANDMLKLVLKERHRELAFEGKRWFDLVRTALVLSKDDTTDAMFAATGMIDNKYASNGGQYRARMKSINTLFFPISQREIDASSNSKDNMLIQNDAYKTDESISK